MPSEDEQEPSSVGALLEGDRSPLRAVGRKRVSELQPEAAVTTLPAQRWAVALDLLKAPRPGVGRERGKPARFRMSGVLGPELD